MRPRPQRLSSPRHLALMAAAGALLWTLTCGPQDQPLAPNSSSQGSTTPTILSRGQAGPGLLGGTSKSKKFKWTSGGSLSLGECTIVIPPGAMTQDATITIVAVDPNLLVYDLHPDGLVFTTPATLSFSYDGLPIEGPEGSLAIWTLSRGVWIQLGGELDIGKKTVSTPLSHFSRYALASD